MGTMKFLIEYIKSPRTIGAIAPSSKKLAEKMVSSIDFDSAECIIEYGPGTGIFTDKLVKEKKEHTMLILLEYNENFCKKLKEKYIDFNNIIVVNDSAENIDKYLKQYKFEKADYIISGLPFTSLPKDVSNNILNKTRDVLKQEGLFITFQYTLLKKGYINNYFRDISLEKVIVNVPPAYVLKCKNA